MSLEWTSVWEAKVTIFHIDDHKSSGIAGGGARRRRSAREEEEATEEDGMHSKREPTPRRV
eukprot:12419350-Karenia_brevis.AAC.1